MKNMCKDYTVKQIEEAIQHWQEVLDKKLLEESANEKDDDDSLSKPMQKMINRLVSAEWLAGNIYALFVTALKKEDLPKVKELLLDTSNDELYDHLRSIVLKAEEYGFDVPSSYKEFTKHADKADVKIFENTKKKQDLLYYVDKVIELEERAIIDYENALELDDVTSYPELQIVFKSNYYDEKEHLESFKFIKYSLEVLVED